MHRYKTFNGPMPTTAVQAEVSTGTTIKTMLQIATPSTRQMQLISWGYRYSTGQSGVVELLQTDVAATVTAHVASGVQPLDPNAPASQMSLGTTGTGYTATAEGAIAATRVFDSQYSLAPDVRYSYQWMPDERPIIAVSRFLRVRVLFGSAVGLVCWVVWDE